MNNIFILGIPRSGTSMLANLVVTSGYKEFRFYKSQPVTKSIFNKNGYFEDVKLNLLNDQLIRFYYGKRFNFLTPPPHYFSNFLLNFLKNNKNNFYNFFFKKFFSYDLDFNTIFLPKNYSDNLYYYNQSDYDNWALTRMLPRKKWSNAYKKYNVENNIQLYKAVKLFNKLIVNKNFCIKDSRLIFTINFYNILNPKIIFISRNSKSLLKSLRNHYGFNLFKKKFITGTKIVTNYFNFKVKYQPYSQFLNLYNLHMKSLKKKYPIHINVQYESIVQKDKKTINLIEKFLDRKIDTNVIKINT